MVGVPHSVFVIEAFELVPLAIVTAFRLNGPEGLVAKLPVVDVETRLMAISLGTL
jgi:hypothetical protein